MTDLQPLKIELFSGINNTPVAPTAERGFNAGFITQKFNQIIDTVEAEFNNFELPEGDLNAQVSGLQTTVEDLEISVSNSTEGFELFESRISGTEELINSLQFTLYSTYDYAISNANDISTITGQIYPPELAFENNQNIFLDTVNGNDDNSGYSNTDAFQSLRKLEIFLQEFKFSLNTNIHISGEINRNINLTNINFSYIDSSNFFIPNINIISNGNTNWNFSGGGLIINHKFQVPVNINFRNINFNAIDKPFVLTGTTVNYDFKDCIFQTTQANSFGCLLEIYDSKIVLLDAEGENQFINNNNTILDSAMKLFRARAKLERLTITGVDVFCIANQSFIDNQFSFSGTLNNTTDYVLQEKSLLMSQNFNRLNSPLCLVDGSSSINNKQSKTFTFFNPANDIEIKLFQAFNKSYKVISRTSDFIGATPNIVLKTNDSDLATVNNIVAENQALTITFEGGNSPSYYELTIEFHELI